MPRRHPEPSQRDGCYHLRHMITLECNGVVKEMGVWGLTAPMVYKRNAKASEFTCRHAGAAFDGEPLFAFGAAIVVRVDNAIVFQGTCQVAPAMIQEAYEGYDYIFADAWKSLEWITYGQSWRVWTVVNGVSVGAYREFSKVTLPARVVPVNGTDTVEPISNGEQIRDVVEWAIAHGANLQVGTITPGLMLPLDIKRDLKCSQVIQMMLKLCPDAVVEIDHSTTPPTFNCIQRATMVPITVRLSDEKITDLKLTRRDDLRVPSVMIQYERVDEIDGRQKVTEPVVDVWPLASTGFEEGAICQTVDLFGGKLQTMRGLVSSEAIAPGPTVPADKQWWIDHGVGWLGDENYTEVVITPGERIGELGLPYILKHDGGGVAAWMRDDNGNLPLKESEKFSALVSYKVNGSEIKGQRIDTRLTMTNLAPGSYSTVKSVEPGEVVSLGLARSIYEALAAPFFDGPVTLTEQECGVNIRLTNTLNVAGGTGRYAAMNSPVQEIAYDLARGERILTLGWPKHLSIDDIIEMSRFNRQRRVWHNPNVRATGAAGEWSEVEMPDSQAMEDASSGEAQYPVFRSWEVNTVELNGKEDATGIRITPGPVSGGAKSAATGRIDLLLADTDGKAIKLREYTMCAKGGVNYKVRLLGSDFYTTPAT